MVVLIIVGVASGCAVLAHGPRNIIADSSLESAALGNKIPEGWYEWKPEKSKHAAAVVSGGHTGKKCFEIRGNDNQFLTLNGPWVGAGNGERYVFSSYVKIEAEKGARAQIKFSYNDKNDGFMGIGKVQNLLPGNADWHFLSITSNPAAYPKAGTVNPMLVFEGTGKAWFDDITLIQVDAGSKKPE